jgi:hypothetical protein
MYLLNTIGAIAAMDHSNGSGTIPALGYHTAHIRPKLFASLSY